MSRKSYSFLAMLAAICLSMALPAMALSDTTQVVNQPEADAEELPPGIQARPVSLVIELTDEPAAVVYAAAKETQAPLRQVTATTKAQVARIEAAQQALLAPLSKFGATVIYRVQRVYNGIAVHVASARVPEIAQLPGVKAIHALVPKTPGNWSSVPLIGAPGVWDAASSYGGLDGTGITIGLIDTGVDYTQADFGGLATTEAYAANDTTTISDTVNGQPLFPTTKVVGGRDFVGDNYTGAPSDIPQPDPDPAPCSVNNNYGMHGTHVAGTAGGYGVNMDGSTYSGSYDPGINFSIFQVGPGVAPKATLYALRVFGCNGGSEIIDQAIEWAVDPNGDSDLSDHLDVINMSLGDDYGATDDSTAVAANNAALAGSIVVATSGNSGDVYYITGTPGSADRVISVAASDDGATLSNISGFRVDYPLSSAGVYTASEAFFGAILQTSGPVTDALAYPSDGAQNFGCATFNLTNTLALAGKIALMESGTCTYKTKVRNAQLAGAIGALLVNSVSGNPPRMGDDPTITTTILIPVEMTNLATGALLTNTVKSGGEVTVTLTAEYRTVHGTITPSLIDTLAAFSSRGPRRNDSVLKPDITAPGVSIFSALAHSGTANVGFSGTSMAAPHIAGAMALLKQLHPDWSVADLKALAMNTATTDITLGALKYDPGRVGAGRVVISNAAASPVIAYNAIDPYLVSVSFGAVEVTDALSITRPIQVINKSPRAAAYSIGFSEYASIPGAAYTITPTSIWLTPHGEQTISITLQVEASQLRHTRAPTVLGGDRAWLSEASGYVVLTPIPLYTIYLPIVMKDSTPTATAGHSVASPALTWPSLRVPVYAAVRPASQMQVAQTVLDFTSITTTTMSLIGSGLNTGSRYPTDTLSLVSAFELAEAWPNEPGLLDRAEAKYLGAGNNFGTTGSVTATTLFFAIATQGNWSVPLAPDVQFKVFIDTNRNGTDDFVLSNDALNYQFTTVFNDVFYSRLTPVGSSTSSYPLPLNYFPAGAYDTRPFGTNVMILAVPANALGLTAANPAFRYRVESYAANNLISASAVHTYTAGVPGLDLSGGLSGIPIWPDLPATTIPVKFNASAYSANGSIGALLLHHQNVPIARTQTITIIR